MATSEQPSDLTANYAGAFANRIGFGERPALVLIDFARAYFDTACELFAGVENALASALRIRERAHERGIPVFLTRVVYHPSGRDGGRFFEKTLPLKHFIDNAPMGDWAEGLVPRSDEVIVSKQYPSAFFGTSLASTLTAMRIDTVLLAGLSTSGCVRASCVDSMSHGFRTGVIADACGDRHPAPHSANLFDMNAKYADVVSEAEAINYLSGLGRS